MAVPQLWAWRPWRAGKLQRLADDLGKPPACCGCIR
ncbi:MAG: hypothetical protein HRU00_05850 [Myxococcales bacterium]|nr:hypothetical protein [Myxococcales bacterium]